MSTVHNVKRRGRRKAPSPQLEALAWDKAVELAKERDPEGAYLTIPIYADDGRGWMVTYTWALRFKGDGSSRKLPCDPKWERMRRRSYVDLT